MSEALIWHCIRDHNSFLHKVGRTNRETEVQFSAEPGNALAVNTFKYSGLANHKATSLEASGNGIVMKRKNAKSANKPVKALSTIPIHAQKKRALKVINNLNLRKDLASALSARYMRLHQAQYCKGSKPASRRN
mgnify:CR=1 FL=1|jgi:hypothetical protein